MGFFKEKAQQARELTRKTGEIYHIVKDVDRAAYVSDTEKKRKKMFSYYNTSHILKEKEGVTIVIAARNEKHQICNTLDSIYETANLYKCNIILVDDCSDDGTNEEMFKKYMKFSGLFTYIRHEKRKGVGEALTTGAYAAKTPYLILMGADLRFSNNNWSEKFIEHLKKDYNQKSLIASTCVTLNEKNNILEIKDAKFENYGAGIVLYIDKTNASKREESWRNIIEARWIRKKDFEGLVQIPCILGACYGVRKDWFVHIKGFEGHSFYGTLEPYISLKSYLAGGDCKCDTTLRIGHLYSRKINRAFEPVHEYYNKIMVANTLFPTKLKNSILKFYKEDNGKIRNIEEAEQMYNSRKKELDLLKKHYKKIFVKDIFEIFDMNNIDYSKFKYKKCSNH